eukprot:TRINITY_DN134_c0_g1_i3.p1 TRINITY_DN134_c0_g1~~TRINITY_DN134_c0_g1_i3.p1  ORF type:complete len:228 (+),score=72.48 TRINITY_DN134_c0_g1_i3:67-750(+)
MCIRDRYQRRVHGESFQLIQTNLNMVKVLVIYYSTYGHIHKMAEAVAEGARKGGAEVDIKRVPETLTDEILGKMGALDAKKAQESVPVATADDLVNYDAIIFGTPTRFGLMAAQMKAFIDSLGQLWMKGALIGKVAGVFTSTGSPHGGQETTIISSFIPLFHLGFVIVGLPYSFQAQTDATSVHGCSPYGASTIAGGKGDLQPHQIDLDGARFQGEHIAKIAAKLAN